MAQVIFSSELQRLTDDRQVAVNVASYRELVSELGRRYPRLDEGLLMAMAVAIDGEIIHDPLLEPIGPDSEVHFLHRISGG